MIELLYHLLTWAEFTLKRIEKDSINDLAAFEKIDWREIDPKIHDWDEGLAAFIATHQQIIALLHTKGDAFLNEIVDYRQYNFRFLLNGLIRVILKLKSGAMENARSQAKRPSAKSNVASMNWPGSFSAARCFRMERFS